MRKRQRGDKHHYYSLKRDVLMIDASVCTCACVHTNAAAAAAAYIRAVIEDLSDY